MSIPIKIHGYDEFPSKSAGIRYLLEENKLATKEIKRRLNCTDQHIHLVKKKMIQN